jgi:hypothetical protein
MHKTFIALKSIATRIPYWYLPLLGDTNRTEITLKIQSRRNEEIVKFLQVQLMS